MKKIAFNQKRFKYGTLATVITVIFIAIVVLINVVFSTLENRLSLKIDLTPNKAFALSSQSKDYLKTLDKDIEVYILKDQASLQSLGTDGKQVTEIINKYKQASNKIDVKFINPEKNPQLISQFNNLYKGDISSKFAVVKCGDTVKALDASDFVNYTQTGQSSYAISSTAERAMTTAIMNVTNANPLKVTVLSSESALAITSFTDMLDRNGYQVETVDALTGTIDPNSSLVILNSPITDLTTEAATRIEKYLDNNGKLGKNLMYVGSYMQKETPNIDALLAEYGLDMPSASVIDEENQQNLVGLSNNTYGIAAAIDNQTYTEGLQNANLRVVVPYSRPIKVLYESKDQRTTESLLKTAQTSFVYTKDTPAETAPSSLEHGPFNVMALGSKFIYDDKNSKITSNIFAIGSVQILSTELVANSNFNNGEYVLNTVNKLTGKENGINIVAKDLTSTTLNITRAQARSVGLAVTVGIPLIIIVLGIFVCVRRRNK